MTTSLTASTLGRNGTVPVPEKRTAEQLNGAPRTEIRLRTALPLLPGA